MKKALIVFCLAVTLSACAGANFYKDEALTQRTALKCYTAKPYLLAVRGDGKDGADAVSIIYLPDMAHPIFIKPGSGIGSRDLKVTLSNGILASFGSTTDPAVADSLKALSGLLSGGAAVFSKLAGLPGFKEPEPGTFALYEILVEADRTVLKKVEFK